MKIQYLGTGGGAGIPEMFCSCRICENSRIKGGGEIRNRSLAVIDDELCIDLPCDARSSFLRQGFDARTLRFLLITHNHYDHFMAENLLTRPEGWDSIELFLSRGSGRELAEKCVSLRAETPQENMRPVSCPNIHFAEPFVCFQCGKYSVIPLPANHAPKLEALNYIISSEGIHILWLHDTGLMREETMRYIQNSGLYFAFVSLDCSLAYGMHTPSDHMDILQCAQTVKALKSFRCVKESTLVYLSHISHLVDRTHQELSREAEEFGFQVAYDGVEIDI